LDYKIWFYSYNFASKSIDLDYFLNNHFLSGESSGEIMPRQLSGQIDWNHRLICIKGFRGVGKTTFILDFIRRTFGEDKKVLYVNLNNFYFTRRRIFSFADEFSKRGGQILFLDQIHKYPGWSSELRKCYDEIPDLKIIFTASPILRVGDENPLLNGIVQLHHLEGLSFREFLNFKTGENFQSWSLEEIISNHISIARAVVEKVKPLAWFTDYLQFGYYPYFRERGELYHDKLLKNINLALEIDIPYLYQVELKYLPKLRKLLFLIAAETPASPNVSKLANAVDTSRATVMNYLNYLKNARLIKPLYSNGDEDQLRKPARLYMHNTNILLTVTPDRAEPSLLRHTFFYNQVGMRNGVKSSPDADFLINDRYAFMVGGRKLENLTGQYCAVDMIDTGEGNKIPLWLFGFLY
jgi:uncharacterized protein